MHVGLSAFSSAITLCRIRKGRNTYKRNGTTGAEKHPQGFGCPWLLFSNTMGISCSLLKQKDPTQGGPKSWRLDLSIGCSGSIHVGSMIPCLNNLLSCYHDLLCEWLSIWHCVQWHIPICVLPPCTDWVCSLVCWYKTLSTCCLRLADVLSVVCLEKKGKHIRLL